MDEDANLLAPMSRLLTTMYEGMGVPVITFENVNGYEKGNLARIQCHFQELFRQYHVRVWNLKASEMINTIDGKVSLNKIAPLLMSKTYKYGSADIIILLPYKTIGLE